MPAMNTTALAPKLRWGLSPKLLLCLAATGYLLVDGRTDPSMAILWAVVALLTLAGLFAPAAGRFFAGTAVADQEGSSA